MESKGKLITPLLSALSLSLAGGTVRDENDVSRLSYIFVHNRTIPAIKVDYW